VQVAAFLAAAVFAASSEAFLPHHNPFVGRASRLVHAVPPKMIEMVSSQLGCEPSAVVEGASFIDDLDADSLDLVELILGLEETFGIEISDEKAAELKTVGDAMALIEELQV
jgi:acyl carrier protein